MHVLNKGILNDLHILHRKDGFINVRYAVTQILCIMSLKYTQRYPGIAAVNKTSTFERKVKKNLKTTNDHLFIYSIYNIANISRSL